MSSTGGARHLLEGIIEVEGVVGSPYLLSLLGWSRFDILGCTTGFGCWATWVWAGGM